MSLRHEDRYTSVNASSSTRTFTAALRVSNRHHRCSGCNELPAVIDPNRSHFTVLTHNLAAFQVLVTEARKEENLNVFLAGGRNDADLNALFGHQTIYAMTSFFPRLVVIGTGGLIAHMRLPTKPITHSNLMPISVPI